MVSLSEETEMGIAEGGNAKYAQVSIGADEVVFNLKDWNLKQNYTVPGEGKASHRFDYVLISTKNEREIIPIDILVGSKTNRMDQIVILYLQAKNLSMNRRYAVSSINVTPYENFLSGIFSVPIVKSIVLADDTGMLRISPEGLYEIESSSFKTSRAIRGEESVSEPVSASEEKKDSIANRRRRDHTRIIHDILTLAKSNGEIGITKIIYRCNLNYRSALRAVSELLDSKLLEIGQSSGAKQKYQITNEGLMLLDDLKKFNFMRA